MRTVSDNGKRFTSAWEVFRASPYFATAAERAKGIYTWGFGHTARKPPSRNITLNEAYVLLEQDMAEAVALVNTIAHPLFNQAQFDAICDLVFNVGPGAVAKGTGTGTAVRDGDIATLRKKLPQFRNQRQPNGELKPELGIYRRAMGRLALFDGAQWDVAEKAGRAITSL